MRLVLIRHAETPANLRGELDTAVPGPGLTERGRTQAAALVDRFAGTDFDAIFASTQTRAQLTAAPLAADRNLQVQVRSGLRELSAGDLEGRTDPAAITIFVEAFRSWILGDLEVAIPGGESGRQVLDRFDAEVHRIADVGSRVALVVSHGGVLRLWAAASSGNIDTGFALANYLVNTGVIVMDGQPGVGWHCHSWDLAPDQRTG